MDNIKLEIGDFLGFCDLNGVEALNSEQVAKLEYYIERCNEAMNVGTPLVVDAIWDRLMDILRRVNPDSELCKHIWEDSVDELNDTDIIFKNNPMYSIMTVKSFDCDEINEFVKRLPDDRDFDAHISVKLNGHGIRLKYQNGDFINARSRARSSAGRDITEQLRVILEENGLTHIDDLEGFDICEVRGEWLLPFDNLEKARSYNPDIKSAFSGVASMSRASATEDEWKLLRFVAYEFLGEGMIFQTKEEEYDFLSDIGFEVPLFWVINDLNKETLIEDLKGIVSDCEEDVKPDANNENGYAYYTDGLVFSINDVDFFRSLGDDGGHYKFGNMALKVGYWKQDMYSGVIQTILWMKGKTKITPVAIVADDDIIEFIDLGDHPYILDKKLIANYNELGVVTASGNKVRRVPLYEPNNLIVLDAYKGNTIFFRYGGEAGVVPCFEDGSPLLEGRVQQMLQNDREDLGEGFEWDDDDDNYEDWED